MELDSQTIIILIIIALVYFVILYLIIEAATRSRRIMNLQRMQVDLMREIALKGGVEPERINEIIERHD